MSMRTKLIRVLWPVALGLAIAMGPALAATPGNGTMAKLDTNGDGRISQQEWMDAARRRFDALDANHDGVLEPAELQQARSEMRERFRRRWEQRQTQNPAGADGVVP